MLELHDLIVDELFEKKSLSALIYLINNGRELEFKLFNKECFITCCNSKKYVSLWIEKNEQSFNSVEELIVNAVVNDEKFIALWKDTELETLF